MPALPRIFLSYNERDRERAARVVRLLESGGWQVWWDRRIPAGRTWRDVLADALERADRVVVLWSVNSIQSDWVCEEASEGARRGKLVPVALDPVLPPVGFRQIQVADLSAWDGSHQDPTARQLLEDLAAHVRDGPRPDEADRIDDEARRSAQRPQPPRPDTRLSALRSRMLTAANAAELQRIGWELEALEREPPGSIECRELRQQLDEAVARARRLEAPPVAARPSAAPAPTAGASGGPGGLLVALLALAVAALLVWWALRPASRAIVPPTSPASASQPTVSTPPVLQSPYSQPPTTQPPAAQAREEPAPTGPVAKHKTPPALPAATPIGPYTLPLPSTLPSPASSPLVQMPPSGLGTAPVRKEPPSRP